jgi:hypothetical protein
LSPKSLGATTSPVMGGPSSPEKALPRPFADLLEEEAIDSEQGKEEEEKEKEKEEKRLGVVCAEYTFCL